MDSIGVQNSDLAEFTLSTQSEIPSLRSGQALRFAQDDSEGLGMTRSRAFLALTSPPVAIYKHGRIFRRNRE
jgi:hypothetical protein